VSSPGEMFTLGIASVGPKSKAPLWRWCSHPRGWCDRRSQRFPRRSRSPSCPAVAPARRHVPEPVSRRPTRTNFKLESIGANPFERHFPMLGMLSGPRSIVFGYDPNGWVMIHSPGWVADVRCARWIVTIGRSIVLRHRGFAAHRPIGIVVGAPAAARTRRSRRSGSCHGHRRAPPGPGVVARLSLTSRHRRTRAEQGDHVSGACGLR
jgi:hypothetical protein